MTCVNVFDPAPSEELSFFLGTWLGDGWGDDSDGGKRLRLKVRSGEFAGAFAKSATAVLCKTKPYLARRIEGDDGTWHLVKVTSVLLFEFANSPFIELARYIEPHPIGFLRAFFTAEGNPTTSLSGAGMKRKLTLDICLSCTDLDYIQFARELMIQLSFHPTNLTSAGKKGMKTNLSVRNYTEWQFRIVRLVEVESFLSKVGFADSTKQEKAQDALTLIKERGPRSAAAIWGSLFTKTNGIWVSRNLTSYSISSS